MLAEPDTPVSRKQGYPKVVPTRAETRLARKKRSAVTGGADLTYPLHQEPEPMSLLDTFATSFKERPSAPALDLGPAGGPVVTLSFGEVEARARRMAGVLRRRGLRAGDRLAAQLGNGPVFVDLFLACLKLGVVWVPMSVLYRRREVAHVVGDAEPRAVVTTPERAELVPPPTPAWDAEELAADAASSGEAAPEAGAPSEGPVERPPDPQAAALLVYTSGTTGRAKGAVLTHANLAANARNLVRAWRVDAADRYLAVLPLFHVHGLGNGLCTWLASGCRMRLVERFEHERAEALFDEFQPTLFFGVPTIYVRLLELPPEPARRIGRTMRLFVSGSAPLPARVFETFRERYGHAILERYGMTETLMTLGNPYDGERRAGTVGRPFPGVEPRIVDEGGADVGDGEVGELVVRSPTLFAGYWRQPEATAAAFRDGWFRTGDLAERSGDGYYTLRGRRSDLVISGGFNVYPREIEDVLLEQPGVREAAVVGAPDERRGEVPVAYVVGDAEPGALEAACRRELASFKVPRAFVFVESLPRNALGKVEKHRLRAPDAAPGPVGE
jgi:malonyl-CoA/methylmalonyl-CoA synthetase